MRTCKGCNQGKSIDEFAFGGTGYRGYKCRECRSKRELEVKVSDPDRWLATKLAQYKHRAKEDNLPCNIDAEYIKWLYVKQGGLCFYSNLPLNWGHNPQSKWLATSVDRVVPSKGYVKGNVVLAQTRINSAKSDFSLEEMQLWMPEWHRLIVSCEWLSES